MFILVKMKDKVRVLPENFDKDLVSAISDEIHLKYCKKVLPDVGFCVSLYQIISIGESFIIPSGGSSWTNVVFILIVFRPHLQEILSGTIQNADAIKGLTVVTDFFDHITIPTHFFHKGTTYSEEYETFTWNIQNPDGKSMMLPLFVGEKVTFRVHSVQFNVKELLKTPPKVSDQTEQQLRQLKIFKQQQLQESRKVQQQLIEGTEIKIETKNINNSNKNIIENGAASDFSMRNQIGNRQTDINPGDDNAIGKMKATDNPEDMEEESHKQSSSLPPMLIVGRIDEEGLGLSSWWS